MKKSLVTLSVLAAASSALASQVRFDALQQARTTRQDFVEMFAQPSVMWSGEVKDQVLFENNSGGVIRTDGEMRYGFYVGREPALIKTGLWNVYLADTDPNNAGVQALVTSPDIFNTIGTPVNLFYGRDSGSLKWGLNLFIASSKGDKTNPEFERSASGLALGVDGGAWRVDAAIGLGLSIKDKTNDEEMKGKSNNRIQAEYDLNENWRLWLDYTQFEFEASVVTYKEKFASTTLGAERRLGHGFFYGLRYEMITIGEGASKQEQTILPIYIGGETEVADWLVLRGAYTLPITYTDKQAGTTSTKTLAGPAVTGGAGLRLGSSLIDISTGVATGNVPGAGSFFGNVAYTYNF